jgi:hypothetical protein
MARQTVRVTATASRDQVLRYRARASHLHEKLPAGSFAAAAWGGLQDSIPRAGVMSLHARVEGTRPDSWEDPSVVQIWFRGGADYIVPRADAGVFTLGSYPQDPDEGRRLETLADDVHRVTEGRTLSVAEVSKRLRLAHQTRIRGVAVTGRAHIRWDASNIWLIPVERPAIDVDDARGELARRFLHWYGPTTVATLARWTGVRPAEARATWADIEGELAEVDVAGERRFILAADLEALERAEPIAGVRLLPMDDPLTKLDKELLVRDEELRRRVVPSYGAGPGYIPGAVLVDGEIVGGWQRQQRKVTIHPFSRLPAAVREAIEAEALAFPIAGTTAPSVGWD